MNHKYFAGMTFVILFSLVFSLIAFGQTQDQEEIGFLLFEPNLSDKFADEAQTIIYLDNLANELKRREITEGQIHVYGYVADYQNDIDPVQLSHDRALFIIGELEKKGLPSAQFSNRTDFDPVGLWGDNLTEDGRKPNRRVRVVIDPSMSIVMAESPEPLIPVVNKQGLDEANNEISSGETSSSGFGFPWWLPIPIIVLAIILIRLILYAIWEPKERDRNHEYQGGYYGEVREIPGKTTAHHMPANSAINTAFGFTGINEDDEKEGLINGWSPALEMDYADHEETASYKNIPGAKGYRAKQTELMQAGKMAEALKKDVDNVLNIQKKRGLGKKYIKGLYEAVYSLYYLFSRTDEELRNRDIAKNSIFMESRNNPKNKALAKSMLWKLKERGALRG